MAKKETTAKNAGTKKKATTKKSATKKETPKRKKIEIVMDKQEVLGPVEPTEEEINATFEESVEAVIKQSEESEPVIVGVNGDPSVIAPVDEKVVDNKESTDKKITKKLNQYFGYFWNGQAIDY